MLFRTSVVFTHVYQQQERRMLYRRPHSALNLIYMLFKGTDTAFSAYAY